MGFFNMLGKVLEGAANYTNDAARRSDHPEIAMKYVEQFNQRVENADLETLEKMLERDEYRVRIDSSNDHRRERRIKERITPLRKKREQEIRRDRGNFDKWIANADVDELERGLSGGKYQVRFDDGGDAERRARLEKKLRPLQEKRERIEKEQMINDNAAHMRRLFREYLLKTETDIYKSAYVFCDFRFELSYLPDFQKKILDEMYEEDVRTLLEMAEDEFKETISNYKWQVGKMKTVAGKSVMILMIAELLHGSSAAAEVLEEIEDLVLDNVYSGYVDEEDKNTPPAGLLEKGNAAFINGEPEKAVGYYLLSAKSGNDDAKYRLALCFLNKTGAPQSGEKIYRLFGELAEAKSPLGVYGLGLCYRRAVGARKDIDKALSFLFEAEAMGNADAMNELAYYYKNDLDEKDYDKALEWHVKAAEKGVLWGLVGAYAMYGNGVEKDEEAELEWFRKTIAAASEQDALLNNFVPDIFDYLGRAYKYGWPGTGGKDAAEAAKLFERGASVGGLDCMTYLIDFDKSGEYLEKATELASRNHSWAHNRLGSIHHGEDKVLASYWFLKAAKYGNADGQWSIGNEYLTGENGVMLDEKEALMWVEKAAAQGNKEAVEKLAEMKEAKAAKQKENEAAERQARKSEALAKKASLEKKLPELAKQLEVIEEKIDSAASEKEEAAAIAEKEGVQAEIEGLKRKIAEVDVFIRDISG